MVTLDLVKMKCVATSIHITVRCTLLRNMNGKIAPINFYGGHDVGRKIGNSYWDIYKGVRYSIGVRRVNGKEQLHLLEWLNLR